MEDFRKYFKVTEKFIYFNHAAVSPLNTYTIEYAKKFLEDALINGSTNYKAWLEVSLEAKRTVARFINAKADEMAIIKNTTSGILLVANGLRLKAGDNIIIPEKEFPANVYPWLNLKRKGVDVKFVKWNGGRIEVDDIIDLIDDRTKLVSISHVQFTNGFKVDLEELGQRLKERGVLFFVDAIQSLGVFDIDVKKCNIDFLAADSHKWLLGPEGIGFFYCKNENLSFLELENFGYMSVKSSDDYMDYDMELKSDSSRFEEGSLNMLGIHTAIGSLKLIEKARIDNIRKKVISLTDYLVDGLKNTGCTIRSPREKEGEKSGIVSFISNNHETDELYLRLMKKRCYVAKRDNAIRISPHFYNSKEEADRFLEIIRQ